VIRYVRGELFFPMSVEDYLMPSRLVAGSTKEDLDVLADRGHLTPDSLAALGRAHSSRSLSIQHVESPLSRAAHAAWRRRPDRERFRASSRFAAVGMPSRLIDVGLRLTLLLRGRVPGGFTAAAHQAYARSEHNDRPHYYAHVTTDGGYTILQYWYLYAMNDFRSTFGGVNDHEGDWEQVTISLVPEASAEGRYRAAWIAASSHDEVGDDLRRRWDERHTAQSCSYRSPPEVAGNPGQVAANAAAPVRSQPVDATCAGVESSEASASGRLRAPASASADAQAMTASGRIRTAPGASTPDASARA
jgi:hypothetical protein